MPTKEKKPVAKTKKQVAVVEAFIKTGSKLEAARIAGLGSKESSNKSLSNAAAQMLDRVGLPEIMEQIPGLKLKDRLICLVEGLYANKQISGIGDASGGSVEFVDVPDFMARHKYLETSFKLDGRLKAAESITNNTQINIMPILGGKSQPDAL